MKVHSLPKAYKEPMKDSHVFPGFDPDYDNDENNNNNEFDLQINFTQFLEEAKRFANEKKPHPITKENIKKEVVYQEKKCMKKSWKTAFFSFWRSSEKKANKPSRGSDNATNPKQLGYFSGPVYDMEASTTGGRKWCRAPVSGPLTSVLYKKNEIPYVSLDRLKEAQYDVKSYGPVYLVS